MRRIVKLLVFLLIVYLAVRWVRKLLAPADATSGSLPEQDTEPYDEAPLGGEVSADLLEILVCPEDKGSLELVDDGRFLLNPRNGYKYPIRAGVPVMLIDEGRKYRDESAVSAPADESAEPAAKES